MHDLLKHTEHRPYPLASGPWIMTQTWERLLFAHWPVPPDIMKEHLPEHLPLDTYDGYAWIGIVPFHMTGIRPRSLPAVPYLSEFPEINVRTYVVRDGKPGVYFFSLDVTNPMAVALARGGRYAQNLNLAFGQSHIIKRLSISIQRGACLHFRRNDSSTKYVCNRERLTIAINEPSRINNVVLYSTNIKKVNIK